MTKSNVIHCSRDAFRYKTDYLASVKIESSCPAAYRRLGPQEALTLYREYLRSKSYEDRVLEFPTGVLYSKEV